MVWPFKRRETVEEAFERAYRDQIQRAHDAMQHLGDGLRRIRERQEAPTPASPEKKE